MEDSNEDTPTGIAIVFGAMVGLIFSPYVTLPLFHPGETWGFDFEYFPLIQLCQLEPLLFSCFLLSRVVFKEERSTWLAGVVAICCAHMFVAFFLITVRGESGLLFLWW